MCKDISLRLATIKDADLLFRWRNDLETRNASRSTAIIKFDEHLLWLSQTLSNPNRKLYVAEENRVPVGTVRADLTQGVWELSWTVSPDARGQGVGKRMVAELAKQIFEPIRAEVKSGNHASIQIAKYAGMEIQSESNGILNYYRAALK